MRQITTTVGPLAAGNTVAFNNTGTPVGTNVQYPPNGNLVTSSFVGTGSISNNILTITAVTSGVLTVGQPISGLSVAANTRVTALGTGRGGIGTYLLNISQSLASTTIYGNAAATFDVPRRVFFSPGGNESNKTFTIVGTNSSGMPQTEIVAGTNAVGFTSNLDYKTLSSVSVSSSPTNFVQIGTTTVASSDWVRLDEWADSTVAVQCTVTGTVNYTLQQTLQDPNSPTNPVLPYAVTWLNSSDASAVNAITSLQTSYQYAPTFARILLNSGTGSVTATFSQSGVVPY